MKKLLLSFMMFALLVVPCGTAALADLEEVPVSSVEPSDYIPGNVPAETGALDSISPAIHAAILAMVNHDRVRLDLQDPVVGWEALYNMLSLYGQMDSRSEYLNDELVLPSETVMDYAAALFPDTMILGQIPQDLSDRIRYDETRDRYLLTCGDDSLAEVQISSVQERAAQICVDGSLVYLVDGSPLTQFQVQLEQSDNMFGYAVTELTLG